MKQYYLSALAHPAKAGTGSSLDFLGAPQWGSGVTVFPQHCANSHRFSDSVKTSPHPTENKSTNVRNEIIGLDISQILETELGLNMKTGETIFTNEPLTPREVKYLSQRED